MKIIFPLLILLIFLSGCVEQVTLPTQEMQACTEQADCIPLPSECHPTSCINKAYEKDFTKPATCTEIFMCSAAYKPEDCGCINNVCTNLNLGKTCK